MSRDIYRSFRKNRIVWKKTGGIKILPPIPAAQRSSLPNRAIEPKELLDSPKSGADANSDSISDLSDEQLSCRIEQLKIDVPADQHFILSLSRNSIQGKESALNAMYDWVCRNIQPENEDGRIEWGAGVKAVLLDQEDFDAFYSVERLLGLLKEEPGTQQELVIVQALFDRYLVNSTKKYNPFLINTLVSAMQGLLRKYCETPQFPLNVWSRTTFIYTVLNTVCYVSYFKSVLAPFEQKLKAPSFEGSKQFLLNKVQELREDFKSDVVLQAGLKKLNDDLTSLFCKTKNSCP